MATYKKLNVYQTILLLLITSLLIFNFNVDAKGKNKSNNKNYVTQNKADKIYAATFDKTNNVKIENKKDKSAGHIGYIKNESYTLYKNIHIPKNAKTFEISTSSAGAGGVVNVITKDGTLVTSFYLAKTGSWQKWDIKKVTLDKQTIKRIAGKNDITLQFIGPSGYLFNIKWFMFK